MILNEPTLAVIAQECVELDAQGVDPTTIGAMAEDLDRMDSDQRRRIMDYRRGAAYEREAAKRRSARPELAPTPALVADWQRRLAKAERDARAADTAALAILVLVVAILLGTVVWQAVAK